MPRHPATETRPRPRDSGHKPRFPVFDQFRPTLTSQQPSSKVSPQNHAYRSVRGHSEKDIFQEARMVSRQGRRTARSHARPKMNVPTKAQLQKMRQAWRDLKEGLDDLDAGISRFRQSLNGLPFMPGPPKK